MAKREISAEKLHELFCDADAAREFDGVWIGACASTRIYCRTLCPAAGHVNFGNVVAFVSPAQAEVAGFRPCLTCCPEDMPRPSIEAGFAPEAVAFDEAVCKYLGCEDALELASAETGLEEGELARVVKDAFGATCEQYLATARRLAAKHMLRCGNPTLDEVAAECGFASGDVLADEFKRIYRLDAAKMAAQRPRGPRLSRK